MIQSLANKNDHQSHLRDRWYSSPNLLGNLSLWKKTHNKKICTEFDVVFMDGLCLKIGPLFEKLSVSFEIHLFLLPRVPRSTTIGSQED